MATETLTFYGTGDEAYELWHSGYLFYEQLVNYTEPNNTLRKQLLSWLRKGAALSRGDWIANGGDLTAPDEVTVWI